MRFRYDNGHMAMPKRKSETPTVPATQEQDDCAFEALNSYPVYKDESYRYFEPGQRKKSDLDSVLKSRKSPMGRIRPNGQLALSEAGQAGSGSTEFLKLLPELVGQIHRAKNNKALADWFVNGVSKWLTTAKRAAFFLGPTISPQCSISSVEVYSHGHRNETASHFQFANIYPTKLGGQGR